MKLKLTSIQHKSLLLFLVLGLNACGSSDFTLDSLPTEFQGNWKGECNEASNTSSFRETWKIKNGIITNTIFTWSQPNCPENITSKLLKLEGTIITTSKKRANVNTVCKKGSAVITQSVLKKLSIGTQVFSGDKNTRKILVSKRLNNILPAYDLMCLDSGGKLHTGDLDTGNGSTEAKRPKEIDPEKSYSKL